MYMPASQDQNIAQPSYSWSAQSPVSSRSPISPVASISHNVSEQLRDVQTEIAIIRDQLDQIGDQTIQENDSPIFIDDNESVICEDEHANLEPEVIVSHFGRGRNCQYRIRWSDGAFTLNRAS